MAGVIKERSHESEPYKDDFSQDDNIALSDDGIFTSLLDKATDKISPSSSSDNISLEKSGPSSSSDKISLVKESDKLSLVKESDKLSLVKASDKLSLDKASDKLSLDKASDKLSLDKASDKNSFEISLEKSGPFSDGASDLDLAGDSGISLADDNDIQLGGASGSSIQDNLSSGQDSGLALLDDELDFSKDELKLSGDSGLSLMEDTNTTFNFDGESEEETRLADPSEGKKMESPASAEPLPASKSDLALSFENSTVGDDEMTIQMTPGMVENFQTPAASPTASSTTSPTASSAASPATSSVWPPMSLTKPAAGKDEDILSFGTDADDEAATVMVDNSYVAGAAHQAMDNDDGVFQIANSEGTSVIPPQKHGGEEAKQSTASAADIFSLSGDDDDEAPTVFFGGGNEDPKTKKASDSDEVFELMDDTGPKPSPKEADDFISMVKDDTSSSKPNAESEISLAKKDSELDSSLVEDFKLDATPESGDESDSESASQLIDVDTDQDSLSDSDNLFHTDDSQSVAPGGNFGGSSSAGEQNMPGVDASDAFGSMGDLGGDGVFDNSGPGGGIGNGAGGFGDGAGGFGEGAGGFGDGAGGFGDGAGGFGDGAGGFGGGLGGFGNDLGGGMGLDNGAGLDRGAIKDNSIPLPGNDIPLVNKENLGGCSYAAGKGCMQEASYSLFDIMFLILGLILLLPTAMAAYELIRYIWSWDQPYALNGTILEFIGGLFKL